VHDPAQAKLALGDALLVRNFAELFNELEILGKVVAHEALVVFSEVALCVP
jgi:hypothetical protein